MMRKSSKEDFAEFKTLRLRTLNVSEGLKNSLESLI